MIDHRTNASDDADYTLFKRKVKAAYGLDLESYKRPQMERRLRANMDRYGLKTFAQYFAHIEKDKAALDEFLDRATINVSEFFRNPDQFDTLQNRIIPELLKTFGNLTVWSAGSSHGAEAYTLAIMLSEQFPGRKYTILGTDIDDRMLDKARKGAYLQHEIRNVSGPKLLKWFDKNGDNYYIKDSLKSLVTFRKHNLLEDPFPKGVDLILCRNVVIYFTEEAKATLYRRFFDSLKPGGYLFVGGTERINEYQDIGYECPISFFYRKPFAV